MKRMSIRKLIKLPKVFLGLGLGVGILVAVGLVLIWHQIFYHPFHKIRKPKFNLPVSSLPARPSQNSNQVIDKLVKTTGCSLPYSLKPGQTNYVQIVSDKQNRRFLVYIPPNFKNTTPHALVIGFHGFNDTPWNLERFAGFDAVARTQDFIAVYPEGSPALGGARGWNTGLHPTIRGNDVLFVSNMLNDLQADLCVNPDQIYAWGFSNGGGFTAELACKLSNRIGAFAPVSGSYLTAFNSCTTTRPVPILEFHGNADSIVPYIGLPDLKEVSAYLWASGWAKRDGCNSDPIQTMEEKRIVKYSWTGCKDNSSVTHYKIIGGHHQWPNVLFPEIKNNQTEYLNTAQTIWNFFKQHPLQQT